MTQTSIVSSGSPKRSFVMKYLLGQLGLPFTFWVTGVLFAILLSATLNYGTSTPIKWLIYATLCLLQAFVSSIAIWNAASRYEGRKVWAIIAKACVIFSLYTWIKSLPEYYLAYVKIIYLI